MCIRDRAQSVNSDFWAATDALGRKVREYGETGERKKDKFVAMFYWTWHIYDMPPGSQVNNTTEILREHPEAIRSFDDPAWNNPGRYYWEQPLFGYYKTTDPWVLRKHAEMLADAGIDVVFFDCTNLTLTWNCLLYTSTPERPSISSFFQKAVRMHSL